MLESIAREDLWFLHERLQEKHGLQAETAEQAILELRRYLALVGLGYRGLGMISPTVDRAWHEFILFTREYSLFCKNAFGEFIHHVPRTSRTAPAVDGGARFAAAYEEVFGALPAIWNASAAVGAATNEPSGCGSEDCKGE
jgi:hypothetical protein